MSKMLRRPPARQVFWDRLQGPSNRQSFGAVDQRKDASHTRGDLTGIQGPAEIRVVYTMQVNPARSQPKLIKSSAAQPVIIWGWRRFVRTHMTAGPRFQGRWAYVGTMIRQYTERGRMTGVATRQGTTYSYPRFRVSPGPRAIQLGGKR